MINAITIERVCAPQALAGVPILDIRSPKEYAKGHIPGSLSLPLFTDEERAVVGTLYNHGGRQAAILKGFDITGPKWSGYISRALELAPDQKVIVHCWRGGMRSEVMAWALNLYGFDVYILKGGYKSFRRWVHHLFNRQFPLVVLAGKTGSNKTGTLQQMQKEGEQILDLEALACHQGSAYGSMGRLVQPSQEQFENNLAWALNELDHAKRIWIEDESITIGRCAVPGPLWQQLCGAPAIELEVPIEQRIEILNGQYGILDSDFLQEATLKIKKRLGPDQTSAAIEDIRRGDMRSFIRRVLVYYDKAYAKSRKPAALKKWTVVLPVENGSDTPAIARQAIELVGRQMYSALST